MEQCLERKNGSSDQSRGRRFKTQRGVALILVIVLSAVALVVMTTALYVITRGTQLSGSEKRYRTVYEAALGGIEVVKKVLKNRNTNPIPGINIVYLNAPGVVAKFTATDLMLVSTIDTDPAHPDYDFYFDLGSPAYRVYAKIIRAKQGSTGAGYKDVDTSGGAVHSGNTSQGLHEYTHYTVTILAEKAANPNERIKMDLVHIF